MAPTDPLAEATAGAAGALVTCVLLMPVDTCKVKIQAGRSKLSVPETMRAVVSAEGLRGLYNGLLPKAMHTVLQNFMYFFTYEWLKARRAAAGIRQTTLVNTVCGVIAGVSNLTLTLPLETTLVRIQADAAGARKGLSQHASELLAEGPDGIWRGFGVSSVLTLNPALTFALFDALKARLRKLTGRSRLSTLEGFLVGSLSKALATVMTYPLIRTKVVMQAKPEGADDGASESAQPPNGKLRRRKGMAETLVAIWQREGLPGLFRGCSAQIFTAVAKSGILLTCKERLAAFALLILMRDKRAVR